MIDCPPWSESPDRLFSPLLRDAGLCHQPTQLRGSSRRPNVWLYILPPARVNSNVYTPMVINDSINTVTVQDTFVACAHTGLPRIALIKPFQHVYISTLVVCFTQLYFTRKR